MRCHYLLVTVAFLDFLEEIFETQAQCSAVWQPDRQALANHIGEHEKFEFLADFAVVALLGFFEHGDVFFQHLLLREADTVNAGKLLAGFVATPVSTSQAQYLDSLHIACRWNMRALAEVGEFALIVKGNLAVLEFGDEFNLVFVAAFLEQLESIGLRDVLSYEL